MRGFERVGSVGVDGMLWIERDPKSDDLLFYASPSGRMRTGYDRARDMTRPGFTSHIRRSGALAVAVGDNVLRATAIGESAFDRVEVAQ